MEDKENVMEPMQIEIRWGESGITEKRYVYADDDNYFDGHQIFKGKSGLWDGFGRLIAVATVHFPLVMAGTPEEIEGRLRRRILEEIEASGHVEYNDCGSRFWRD